jgi:aminoglycoside 3-N-acetyltransferase
MQSKPRKSSPPAADIFSKADLKIEPPEARIKLRPAEPSAGPLNFAGLKAALQSLELNDKPVIAHASVRSFGPMAEGALALFDALIASVGSVVMPTFTYKSMITPESGPPNNGITYGAGQDLNRMAEPFRDSMPADPLMGALPEILRRHPGAKRTQHPILSFAGLRADAALAAQTILEPLAPIGEVLRGGGWVLLLGVDHTVNTSIHFAEKLVGRKQFTRWALLPSRVVECPGFPGDSAGFNDIAADLARDTLFVEVGSAVVQAVPLKRLLDAASAQLRQDPLALLCRREDCERCAAVRAVVFGRIS